MDSTTYQDSTSQSNYTMVRTQKDFYHTKWSNYKKPEWYHPYNGLDWRSEYLYTKRDDDMSDSMSPYRWKALDFANNYRPYLYLLLFGVSQLYLAYKYYRDMVLEQ